MAQRRFHYEQAFEHYLRANRIPYVAVDEAKKTLVPSAGGNRSLKSFDFVVYTPSRNLLVDVKGRMYGSPRGGRRTFESWVPMDDVRSLQQWQELFGDRFEAVFVFTYCLRQQPPDALFEVVFAYGNRWYALREAPLQAYRRVMVDRSPKWETVYVPSRQFAQISRPFEAHRRADQQSACGPRAGAIS